MMVLLYSFLLIMVPLVVAQRPAENKPHWFQDNNPDNTTCCECVSYLKCKDGNLTNLSHSKKVNVQKCESVVEFCCLNPNAPSPKCDSFKPGPMPRVNTDPQPKKACDCVNWFTCAPEKVVTDGKGAPSDMGLTTHSKCPKKSEVCCQESHATVSTRAGGQPPEEGDCVCVPQEQCVDGVLNTDGSGIIQPRVRAGDNCPNQGVKCCGLQPVGSGNKPLEEGDCVCVPQEQCVDGVLNTDGSGIIQPRVRADDNCPNQSVKCCGLQPVGSGNERNGNCLIFSGFVAFISIAKGILISFP